MAEMISVDEALDAISSRVTPSNVELVSLNDSLDLLLAEHVVSPIDSPPYDKSLMDGFAVRLADVSVVPATLHVVETLLAGQVSQRSLAPGEAIQIMTGAPIPSNADLVIPVEQVVVCPDKPQVTIAQAGWRKEQNILRQSAIMCQNDTILSQGTRLRPMEIGLLAEMGCAHVGVYPRPRIAIIATGNELVAPGTPLGPGQIWNSNGPMLNALVRNAGGIVSTEEIVGDNIGLLEEAVTRGLQHDVLILTGGVSMGSHDFVPHVLSQAGIEPVFHKVRLKPGKPVWFGVGAQENRKTIVFGLPGNPVSTLVCFELFVRPALARLRGQDNIRPQFTDARLTQAFQHRGDRPTYFPGRYAEREANVAGVTPLAWKGSADVRTFSEANCLIRFASGDCRYEIDDTVSCYLF